MTTYGNIKTAIIKSWKPIITQLRQLVEHQKPEELIEQLPDIAIKFSDLINDQNFINASNYSNPESIIEYGSALLTSSNIQLDTQVTDFNDDPDDFTEEDEIRLSTIYTNAFMTQTQIITTAFSSWLESFVHTEIITAQQANDLYKLINHDIEIIQNNIPIVLLDFDAQAKTKSNKQ